MRMDGIEIMDYKPGEDDAYLRLEGVLTVYEVAELRETLIAAFEKKNGVVLDLGNVTDIDTTGIQLLCSAYQTAKNTKKGFTIMGANDSFKEAISRIGLNSEGFLACIGEV